ncbi:LuxR C-terminal-related transcriptional regulator [Elizabethkingia anophelis]|uniref:LuxR C-terminal-related transcriptional regulator n=1 Tax=Elizabethkingia anophelis TaxID=1117645 RepID=UPI00293C45D1|nr:hypothetical protein [Elizabethkingia anophelis]
MKKIPPMRDSKFQKIFVNKTNDSLDTEMLTQFFLEKIAHIKDYAIGPFFWMISSYHSMKVVNVSENIESFTPLSRAQWVSGANEEIHTVIHPEDFKYWLAAAAFIQQMYMNMEPEHRENIKFNIYARVQNPEKEYRWVLVHYFFHLDSSGIIDSNMSILYDLSHLQINSMPLLSVIDFSNKEVQYFKHVDQQIKKVTTNKLSVTKREQEVLKLVAEGYNTTEISDLLFISSHTVENHKKNLRRKTDTKSLAELVAYAIKYNLLFI